MKTKDDNTLFIVNSGNRELDIDNNRENIVIDIYRCPSGKLEGKKFKIEEQDRVLYKLFSEFFENLKDVYNTYKDFHDFYYSNQKLYDEKHNWFTFYSGENMLRIIKKQQEYPFMIGIYIKSNNESFILNRKNPKYAQFIPCFDQLTKQLEKISNKQSKLYTKGLNNGQ